MAEPSEPPVEVTVTRRPQSSRAAAAYLGFFLVLLAIWAVVRGAGKVVVPVVLVILVGGAMARWLRSWWGR